MIIDTHAHLYLKDFEEDIEQIIERAKAIEVKSVYLPNIDSESLEAVFDLCDRYPDMFYPMAGLHPVYVRRDFREELRMIESRLDEREIFAIGEIGTDLFRNREYRTEQEEAFHIQCGWALDRDLPIVIHSRDSIDWQIELVQSYKGGLRGIFHCFTGSPAQAEKIINEGFLLGVGGIVTFKNSGLEETLKYISLNSLVLETDAPYLAPVPFRGKRNEPGYLRYIVMKLAEIYDVPEDYIREVTSENAKKLFHTKAIKQTDRKNFL